LLINDGSVFLTNTTVCEASRACQQSFERAASNRSDQYYDATRIFDLLCLLDAAVLYDRIYCLPGNFPFDVGTLLLREALISRNVIEQVPASTDFEAVSRGLLASLSQVEGYEIRYGDGYGSPLRFSDFERRVGSELGLDTAGDGQSLPEGLPPLEGWFGYYFDVIRYAGDRIYYDADSFDEVARRLLAIIQSQGTGSESAVDTDLRMMYYVFMAEHLSIPYWPSTFFQRMSAKFPNYFTSSTRAKIYERLAKALNSAVHRVAHEFAERYFFMPPFSAIILDRAARPNDISTELIALREEYQGFRAKMSNLERERREAKAIGSRLKIMAEIDALCEQVSKPFANPSRLTAETDLKYVPDLVSLASNPSNPASWANVLLAKPVEMLLEWYYQRPVKKLVKTGRQVASLASYNSLLTKHFGVIGTEAVRQMLEP
jgi:hypothetical protein